MTPGRTPGRVSPKGIAGALKLWNEVWQLAVSGTAREEQGSEQLVPSGDRPRPRVAVRRVRVPALAALSCAAIACGLAAAPAGASQAPAFTDRAQPAGDQYGNPPPPPVTPSSDSPPPVRPGGHSPGGTKGTHTSGGKRPRHDHQESGHRKGTAGSPGSGEQVSPDAARRSSPGPSLPFTGLDLLTIALGGLLLVALGMLLRAGARGGEAAARARRDGRARRRARRVLRESRRAGLLR